jgi:hypothetical protein
MKIQSAENGDVEADQVIYICEGEQYKRAWKAYRRGIATGDLARYEEALALAKQSIAAGPVEGCRNSVAEMHFVRIKCEAALAR